LRLPSQNKTKAINFTCLSFPMFLIIVYFKYGKGTKKERKRKEKKEKGIALFLIMEHGIRKLLKTSFSSSWMHQLLTEAVLEYIKWVLMIGR
jgi:hypothetical protein